jgi:hypothetical protein
MPKLTLTAISDQSDHCLEKRTVEVGSYQLDLRCIFFQNFSKEFEILKLIFELKFELDKLGFTAIEEEEHRSFCTYRNEE